MMTSHNSAKGTIVGLLVSLVSVVCTIKWHRRSLLKKRDERKKKRLLKRSKELEEAMTITKESNKILNEFVGRSIVQERESEGLVILDAYYGIEDQLKKFDFDSQLELDHLRSLDLSNLESQVIDVVIPLQFQVQNSSLALADTTKSSLPGFYDPSLEKSSKLCLFVRYSFGDQVGLALVDDYEALTLK